ncbi:MAG: hypothetical protein KF729_24270, partial [Sandaracinaceae bacterium]|nr:hypothetical protein [Sandaracinaceae bacterium]
VQLSIAELAATYAKLSLGLGAAGALFAATAWAAWRSAAAAKAAAALGGALVPGALLLAAPLTPPDAITQLTLAVVLVASWIAGLAVAAGIAAVRRAR